LEKKNWKVFRREETDQRPAMEIPVPQLVGVGRM
jgi:hypothetical protein